jgi:bifunctional DNA-binding transcriptional regulator/antitoxin component of YhaV-PrlF toxin-antitoxin module
MNIAVLCSICGSSPISRIELGTRSEYSHTIFSDMSGEVRTDERGRVTIPKEVRDRYGEKFRLVELDSGIKLVPIPDDPLEALRAAASDELREAPLADLEEAAQEEAREQAVEQIR